MRGVDTGEAGIAPASYIYPKELEPAPSLLRWGGSFLAILLHSMLQSQLHCNIKGVMFVFLGYQVYRREWFVALRTRSVV